MRSAPDLDERTAEDILCGRTVALDDDDRVLAEALANLRSQAVRPVQPNARLLQVFADGFDQDPSPAAPPAVALREVERPAVATSFSRARGRMRGRVAQVAGLSLVAKLALAGAAAAAAVGGAGAAGVLPGQDGTTHAPPGGAGIDLGRPLGVEPTQDGADGRGADGRDVADDTWRGRDEGSAGSGPTPDADGTGSGARSDRRVGPAGETAQQPWEQGGGFGERGLSRAGDRTARSPGSAPQSEEGRAHAERRRSENPAPVDPPAQPPAGSDHAGFGSASGPPPSSGRNDEDRGPDGPRRDHAGRPS